MKKGDILVGRRVSYDEFIPDRLLNNNQFVNNEYTFEIQKFKHTGDVTKPSYLEYTIIETKKGYQGEILLTSRGGSPSLSDIYPMQNSNDTTRKPVYYAEQLSFNSLEVSFAGKKGTLREKESINKSSCGLIYVLNMNELGIYKIYDDGTFTYMECIASPVISLNDRAHNTRNWINEQKPIPENHRAISVVLNGVDTVIDYDRLTPYGKLLIKLKSKFIKQQWIIMAIEGLIQTVGIVLFLVTVGILFDKFILPIITP